MKQRVYIVFALTVLLGAVWAKGALALEHIQKEGLFKIDVPAGWHWFEYPEEVVITYADSKTVAIDIQMVSGFTLSEADAKKTIKESNERMVKQGIEAHNGALINNKEIRLDGVYATRLDFKTNPNDPLIGTYISFINKGHAFTITYASSSEKIRLTMDDAVETLKLK